jgi:hypothetical protein
MSSLIEKISAIPKVQPVVMGIPTTVTPSRTIERLGFHHGEGLWRVRVGEQEYFGNTERDAITEAVVTILEQQQGPVTFDIHPNL